MTQQQFSNAVEKTLGTIAVWETSKPPRGEALLDLAEFAWRNQHAALSRDFELLFLDEVIPRLNGPTLFRTNDDGTSGFMLVRFDNLEEARRRVQSMHRLVNHLEEAAKQ